MTSDDKTVVSSNRESDDATRVAASVPVDDATKIAGPADDATRVNDDRTRISNSADLSGNSSVNASRIGANTSRAGETSTQSFRSAADIGGDFVEVGVGSIINNRFTLHELLGSGGMGQVYRAIDERKREANDDNPYIAIKLLRSSFASHPASFITLQREAKKTQTLAHPNIVTVYDFDRDRSIVYMTMEELRGISLDRLIRDNPPDRQQALQIIRDIAVGLAYAHSKGFVHSDLKPGNIFITENGGVKVLDFGIARAVGTEQKSDSFDAAELGALTPKYASLEMFEGAQPDPRDDIYALGIIACQLLGGGHPYNGKSAKELSESPLAPTLPQAGRLLKSLLRDSVMLHAKDRVASVDTFIKRFDFAIGGYKKAVAAGVVATAVIIGNLVYWLYFNDTYPALSTLPPEQQQQFHHLIDEANAAYAVGDIDGTLFYLDDAYAIHKKDKSLVTLSEQILKSVKESTKSADAETQKQAIEALKKHPLFKDL